MGVDTNGLINKNYTALDVLKYIQENVSSEAVLEQCTLEKRMSYINLNIGDEHRNVLVLTDCADYQGETGDKDMHTLVKLSTWGSAKEIIEGVVKHFGGYYCPNDCNGDFTFFPWKDDKANQFENEVYNLVVKNYNGKNTMDIFKFIMNNLEEIKKLKKV